MKTFLMTLAAAGVAAGAAPAMAQYGYHDDSAHHRYVPASYSPTSYGTSYGYAARPYATTNYGTGSYATGGHYDYHAAPAHGVGYGVSRPAAVFTLSYNTGYGSYGGYAPAYPTYRPAASSWGHTDADHHRYGW